MCILDYTHDTLFDSVIGTNASVTLLTKEKDRRNRTELWEDQGVHSRYNSVQNDNNFLLAVMLEIQ